MTDELGLQESFESFRLVQLFENAKLLFFRELGIRALELVLKPCALSRVLNVHVLDTHGAAVAVAQNLVDVSERHL